MAFSSASKPRIGISAINAEECKKLVGIGTDGASANIASAGLKGLVEKEVPWVFWMWCLAHRLELAVKDALKGTAFDLIDEMLVRLHYIYERSPKKCRELEEVINALKQCLEFDDAGVRPVRACGSRWVSHKLSAMSRVVSKFGAYTSHLAALSEDSSVKAADRAKLKGYLNKWLDAKYLLGCAFFVDLLLPCSIFSKVMQSDTLDVLSAFTSLLRSVKELNKLCSKGLEHWPTYTATQKKISEENGENVYQCQALKRVAQAKEHYSSRHQEYCSSVTTCLKTRLAWSDLQLIRDVIFVLETQGWFVDEDDAEAAGSGSEQASSREPIVRLAEGHFKVPLEGAGVDIDRLPEEFHEILLHATQFISLSTTGYQAVWWRLFHAPNASDWSNILTLVRLLFTLPVSNGKLERVFSTLKLIKVDKRSLLANDTLDDLLVLNTDRVPMKEFKPDRSIHMWWNAKTRRPNQHPRKVYKKTSVDGDEGDSDTSDSPDTCKSVLDDWDEFTAV